MASPGLIPPNANASSRSCNSNLQLLGAAIRQALGKVAVCAGTVTSLVLSVSISHHLPVATCPTNTTQAPCCLQSLQSPFDSLARNMKPPHHFQNSAPAIFGNHRKKPLINISATTIRLSIRLIGLTIGLIIRLMSNADSPNNGIIRISQSNVCLSWMMRHHRVTKTQFLAHHQCCKGDWSNSGCLRSERFACQRSS